MAAASHVLTLRIKSNVDDVQGADWPIPADINFRTVLDVMSQVLLNTTPLPTAFEYEDEDGDYITVSNDDELFALLSYSQWKCEHYGITAIPICIYPKVQRVRNPLMLEVNTVASSLTVESVNTCSESGSQRNADEQALINLLSGGHISPQELHFLEILGHGSGGTVYRTFHSPTKVVMAVKVLPLDVTIDEQRQIMSEMEILHKCDSQYIIGFYGSFFQENRISICTEYMDGGSLDQYAPISENVLSKITVAILKGLNYLWSIKVLHRDIKPSNMLVNTHGQIKLCDFGVSVQAIILVDDVLLHLQLGGAGAAATSTGMQDQVQLQEAITLMTSLTKTYIGTNAYMAPERILGGEYGVHSDIWSLGLSLMELSLGHFPYLPERTRNVANLMPFDLLQCIVNEEPPELPRDKFSSSFLNFISLCMQKLASLRPGIKDLLCHMFPEDGDDNESFVSQWLIQTIEQHRITKQFSTNVLSNSESCSAE